MQEYVAEHCLGTVGLWYCRLVSVWGLDQLATDESQAPNPSGAILEMKQKPGACPSLGRAGLVSTHTRPIVSNPTKELIA